MKKHIASILIAALAVLSFSSCTKDNGREDDGRKDSVTQFNAVSDRQITVGPEAATHVIRYEIVNPTGASVTAEADAGTDWISDINSTSAYGEVYFSVSVNNGGESRQAGLTLSYEGITLDFTVTQEAYSSFSIKVLEDECTSGKIAWEVTPPSEDLTYVSMIADKATWDTFSSFEEYVEYDLEYFREQAGVRNLSFEEFMGKYVLRQGKQHLSADDLTPETDYIVYAYGMNRVGELLAGMDYVGASTLPVEQKDATFELTVEQDFPYMTISADPSDDEVRYLMDVYSGTDSPEVIAESYQEMLDELITLLHLLGGGSVYDYFMEVSFQGPGTTDQLMIPEAMEFTAFAVAIDVYTGQITSGASTLVCEIDFGF